MTESRDGRAAWDRLRHGEQYALILTDVSMPRMSGLDLLAAVRDARLKTPVIVVSGDPRNRAAALLGGARAFLNKPFRLEELEAAIEDGSGTVTADSGLVSLDAADNAVIRALAGSGSGAEPVAMGWSPIDHGTNTSLPIETYDFLDHATED